MTLTHPLGFFGSEPSGGNATVFPSRDAYAVFDGVNDYVSIPSNSVINALTNTMSFAFWINPKSFLADSRLIERGIIGSVNQFTIMFNSATGRLRATIDGQTLTVDVANSLIVGEWSFVVYTYDGTTARFYINGSEVKSAVQSIDITGGTGNIYISKSHVAGNYVNAYMRDVRIYNDALTADEVTYLYTRGESGADPTNDNLVGHWKFDDGEGSLIADSSGNGNDGQAHNITEPAFWDKYATFDGVDDYVDLGADSYLAPSSFSVSLWFKMNSTPAQYDGLVSKTNGSSWTTGWGIWWNSASQLKAQVYESWTVGPTVTVSNPTQWNHAVLTFDGTTTKLYINGSSGTDRVMASSPSGTANPLRIGHMGTTAYSAGADIRDIRIYNDALTSNEVTYIYTAGESGTDPTETNLVGKWLLNDGEGSVVADSSASGNDGTAIGITEPAFWNQPHANFDGTDDYVGTGVGVESTYDFTTFSISCWVNPSEIGDAQYTKGIVAKETGASSDGFSLGIYNGNWLFWVSGSAIQINTSFAINAWKHLVGIYDGTNIKLYLNGVQIGATTAATLVNNNDELTIGRWIREGNTDRYFFGKVSNVLIYNDALTASEITYLATAGEQGTDPGTANLVGRWKLGDRYGTNVEDSAGANDGTAINITESTFWIQG